MIKEFVGLEEAIDTLNRLISLDKAAATCLVDTRIPCSVDVALDETIQAGFHVDYEATIGMLGVINGIFGVDSDGNSPIVALYDCFCSEDPIHSVGPHQGAMDACETCGAELQPLIVRKFIRNPNLKYED